MLLWVSCMVGIVSTAILIKIMDKPTTVLGIVDLIVAAVSDVTAFTLLVLFIGANVPVFKKAEKIKLEEQRKAIMYAIESNGGNIVGLTSDISEYNAAVAKGRMYRSNVWTKNISYDFWDDLELIEVSTEE